MNKAVTPRYIVIHGNLFTEKDWERFGCDHFQENGYEVLALECLDIFYPNARDKVEQGSFQTTPRARRLSEASALATLLDGLRPTDLVLMLWELNHRTAWVYKKLSEKGARYAVINGGAIPDGYVKTLRVARGFWEKLTLLRDNWRGHLYEFKSAIKLRVDPKLNYFSLSPPAYWIRAGNALQKRFLPYPKLHRARVLAFKSYDAGLAYREKTTPANFNGMPKEPYALFLAVPFLHGPDVSLVSGTEKIQNPERHFAALNVLFSRVEKELGLPVVIAAHPKTDLDREIPLYRGRQVIPAHTVELTHNCDLVLSTMTTSISFAVFFRKPILFITTNELDDIRQWRREIRTFASWFNEPPLNADSKGSSIPLTIPKVDEALYQRYHEAFLEEGDCQESVWARLQHAFETQGEIRP